MDDSLAMHMLEGVNHLREVKPADLSREELGRLDEVEDVFVFKVLQRDSGFLLGGVPALAALRRPPDPESGSPPA